MTHDIVTLYVSLLSQFFSQPSAEALARDADDPNATPPLPDWVPTVSNATTDSHWLIRVLAEVNDCGAELGALELSGEATQTLKELVIHVRSCFEAAVCSAWIRGESGREYSCAFSSCAHLSHTHADAKTFYRLENWRSDPDQPSITVFLRHLAAYQRFMAASAYRIAGGSEELASSCFSAVTPTTGGAAAKVRARQEDALPKDLTRRIQSAFLDGLYAFLDGLVHVAFSDPASIFAAPSGPPRKTSIVEATSHSGRPAEIDTQNVVRL